MAWDYKFDPVTEDLIDDGAGSFVRTETAETSVRNQVKAHYGQCWQDPELGTQIHDLNFLQADPANIAADDMRRALGRLEASGRILDVDVIAEESVGHVAVATSFRDARTNQLVDLALTKAGG